MRRTFTATLAAVLVTALPIVTAPPSQAAIVPIPPSTAITSLPLPTHELARSKQPVPLTNAQRPLSLSYTYDGQSHTIDEYLLRSTAQGLVVLDGQKIVHELYFPGAGPKTLHQSWSVAKSFTSAAVGIALSEGRIGSIDEPVTKYLPELNGTGYQGVSIRNLLRMSSGIAWTEEQDVPVVHLRASLGNPVKAMARERVRGWTPGTRMNYTSMNSFVLAWLVTRATGTPYHRYVASKIWGPAGMADTGYTGADWTQVDLGYCCYYATDRDFARFGLMYLRGGKANGKQVVPKSWVTQSTRPSASFNEPTPASVGYGLHWWVADQGDYSAVGLGGQLIYVNPRHGVVIAQSTILSTVATEESVAAFRAIAQQVAAAR